MNNVAAGPEGATPAPEAVGLLLQFTYLTIDATSDLKVE